MNSREWQDTKNNNNARVQDENWRLPDRTQQTGPYLTKVAACCRLSRLALKCASLEHTFAAADERDKGRVPKTIRHRSRPRRAAGSAHVTCHDRRRALLKTPLPSTDISCSGSGNGSNSRSGGGGGAWAGCSTVNSRDVNDSGAGGKFGCEVRVCCLRKLKSQAVRACN